MCLDLGRQIISCPICGNETFNDWFICPHCNWEAEILHSEDEYSPANKSTIAKYRREYFRLQTNRLERIDKIMNRNISILLDQIKKNVDGCTDYKKIKELTPNILVDWKDIISFLYCLPECNYDIYALEAVLLAVDGDVRDGREGNGQAKAALFHLYHDGEYEVLIHDRLVKIHAPELKSRERYDEFLSCDCPDHMMHVGDEDIIPNVHTLDAHDYMMLYLFGTNCGRDRYDHPTEEIDEPSAKNYKRAIDYLPTFVDYLATQKLPAWGMELVIERMEKAGYSFEEITRFCREWFETIEKKNLVCEAFMSIYLFGKYEFNRYGKDRTFDFSYKKSFSAAKSFIHTYVMWLEDVYSSNCVYIKDYYDPDLVLNNFVRKMRASRQYSDTEISEFATIWMREMLKQNKAFYSLMYMRLFEEHFGGTSVNIDGVKNFDAALALIPKYLEYIFSYYGLDDECPGKFDPDCELYDLSAVMRKRGYTEDEINTFVTRWVNAAIASGHPCNSTMNAYLLGQFIFKHEDVRIDLTENVKSFEHALEYIPMWLEFLCDQSIQYHYGYSPTDIIDLVIRMHENEYSDMEIELLLSKFVEALSNISPYEVQDVKRNLLTHAEKQPWLNKYLPLYDQYAKAIEEQNHQSISKLMF